MDLIRKNNPNLKPFLDIERPPCPFYGFDGEFGAFEEGGENQCGLVFGQCIYCKMLLHKETPNWNKCEFNTEKNKNSLAGILANMKIFPRELKPQVEQEAKSWRGIEFAEWVDYVMREKK